MANDDSSYYPRPSKECIRKGLLVGVIVKCGNQKGMIVSHTRPSGYPIVHWFDRNPHNWYSEDTLTLARHD